MCLIHDSARLARFQLHACTLIAVPLQLHARTHGDGDYAALSWRKETSPNSQLPTTAQPLVLVGPMEHHSNVLIWRESGGRGRERGLDG